MGDVAKGIKSFKKGMAEDETPPPPPSAATPADPKIIDAQATPSAPAKAETKA
jgi:sec-independent protein translocase protein TatA